MIKLRPKLEKTVYVLNFKGMELPKTDYRTAKKLLKENKAIRVCNAPYTIQLTIATQ